MNVVLVLSNHRSGSSVFTGCLKSVGFNLGKSESTVKNEYNPKGYFENHKILRFNQKVLKQLGGSWKNPPTSKNLNQQMMKFAKELKQLIQREYPLKTQNIAIKDPRIIILYPLYVQVLKDLGLQIHLVWLDRDHQEIAQSLNRAQNLDLESGLRLCQYNQSRVQELFPNLPHLEFHFNEILSKPVEIIEKLNHTWNLNLEIPKSQIESLVDPKLRNFSRK